MQPEQPTMWSTPDQIVTDEINKYMYAYGYAGIPRGFKDCAEDVATVHNNAVQFFKCVLCPNSYSNKNGLSYHTDQKHLQPVQKHLCDLCDSLFTTLASLKRHKNMKHKSDDHQAATELTCEDCGDNFLLLSNLKRHQ